MSQSYKFISLFSGIGGLDTGLHNAGYEPLFFAEKDVNALVTLKLWLSQQNIKCDLSQSNQIRKNGHRRGKQNYQY